MNNINEKLFISFNLQLYEINKKPIVKILLIWYNFI